jgi:hypothetical protein
LDPEEIAKGILETVKARVKGFLEAHADAKEFVEDRAKDLGELLVELARAGSDAEREKIRHEMEIAKQAIDNEVAGVAVEASAEARATFREVMGTVGEFVVKALPGIIAAI